MLLFVLSGIIGVAIIRISMDNVSNFGSTVENKIH